MAQSDLVLQDVGHADNSYPVPASTSATVPAIAPSTFKPNGATRKLCSAMLSGNDSKIQTFQRKLQNLLPVHTTKLASLLKVQKLQNGLTFAWQGKLIHVNPLEILANYIITLHEQFLRGNSVHQYLRALSHIICKECRPMLKDPDITLMIKACQRLQPQVPR